MQEAQNYFEQAAVLDPTYPNAILNKAAVLTIDGQLDDAAYFADKAFQLAKEAPAYAKTLSDVLVLKGNLAYKNGKVEDAKRFFQSAEEIGNALGKLNRQIVEQKIEPLKSPLPDTLHRESIDGQSLDVVLNNLLMGSLTLNQSMQLDKQTLLGIQELEHSQVFLHFQAEQGDYALLHLTGNDYPKTTSQGVNLGDEPTAIERAYGTPPRRVQTSTGTFWVYPIRKLLFRFNEGNRLVEWGTFRTSATSPK